MLTLFLGSCAGSCIEADADLDASIDSDAGFDAAPSPIELGTYALEWTCVTNCLLSLPYSGLERFTIEPAGEVALWTERCGVEPECLLRGSLVDQRAGCTRISGLEYDGVRNLAWELCASSAGITGTVEHTGYPGPLGYVKRWRFVGMRVD